ncbi:MAG: glycosyltransferase family 2 protein [Anaerolineales bacterium]
MTAAISIITPSYNQSQFLEQTIRSVLDQGIHSLEYFVVDGGSTDSSVDIIRRYENKLAGWVSEKDRGQAEAINKGIKASSGEIVAWLNSDDFYLPGAIQAALKTFREHPTAGLVYGDVLSVDAQGRTFNVQRFRQYDLADLMSFRIISQPAVFMRRAILEQAGLLDESFHLLLDHHLWLRMARLAPLIYLPQTLAAARYHTAAKNLARTAEFGREALQIVDWMQTDPNFSPVFEQHHSRVLAGAHRLDAFYLLDGGFYPASLAAYARAFRYNPGIVLPETHRVIYALLAPLGLKHLRPLYTRVRSLLRKHSLGADN